MNRISDVKRLVEHGAMLVTLAVTLAACTSDVLQIGPDTYRVSTESSFTRGGAEAEVVGIANKHCAALGRRAEVTSMDDNAGNIGVYASATPVLNAARFKEGSSPA